jgi:hypothetical protein
VVPVAAIVLAALAILSRDPGPAPLAVTLTRPVPAADVAGLVPLEVRTSRPVRWVRWYVDGREVARDTDGRPWRGRWESGGVAAGAHAVVARVRAPDGSEASTPEIAVVVHHARVPDDDELVVAAAGDIADDEEGDETTATVVRRLNPELVLTTGDNAYPDGRLKDFERHYDPTWGAFRAITRPVAGNHEYRDEDAAGYFAYFGDAAGAPRRGYYAFRRAGWLFVALNTEVAHGPGSAQLRWLEHTLRRARELCAVAYWHEPRFTAGTYDDAGDVAPFWRALHRAGVEVVLNGHHHVYARYGPLDPAGRADRQGIRQFVVGTGGRELHELGPDRRRAAGTDTTHGVLELRLRRDEYDFRFVPVAGSRYADAGTGIRCR